MQTFVGSKESDEAILVDDGFWLTPELAAFTWPKCDIQAEVTKVRDNILVLDDEAPLRELEKPTIEMSVP